jgi:hypothetical protein
MTLHNEESEEIILLHNLIRYFDHNPKENQKFVEDVHDFYLKHKYITGKQHEILEKIAAKVDLEKFLEKY